MKRIFVFLISVMFLAIMLSVSGCAIYTPMAYNEGYVSASVPSVAFSFVGGVDAYWMPNYSSYVYGGNGYYYMWVNGGWVYSNYYYGPWYPIPQAIVLPPVLVYGPPPPVVVYQPYYTWWNEYYAPWWEVYHPYWWSMNSAYVVNYNVWVNHVTVNNYYNVTYNQWGVHTQVFAMGVAQRNVYFQRRYNTFAVGHPGFIREHPNFVAAVPASLRQRIPVSASIRSRITAPPAMMGRDIKMGAQRAVVLPIRHMPSRVPYTPNSFGMPSHRPGPVSHPGGFGGFRPPPPHKKKK